MDALMQRQFRHEGRSLEVRAELLTHAWHVGIFEPDRVAYDPERQALRLFATEDFMLVHCAVSKAALAALEDDALGGPHAMATTYRRHRERIQELATRKYRERRFEAGGFVVVRRDDLTD